MTSDKTGETQLKSLLRIMCGTHKTQSNKKKLSMVSVIRLHIGPDFKVD